MKYEINEELKQYINGFKYEIETGFIINRW